MRPIEVWTDGACARNPGPGGWAYIITDGTTAREGSGGESATTNNRMELTAVIEGLRALPSGEEATVITDASYVEQPFTLGWIKGWERRGWQRASKNGKPQELKNADLWRTLAAEVKCRKISWQRVKGHSGVALNERCDQLAVAATINAGGKLGQMVELGARPVRNRPGRYGSKLGTAKPRLKATPSQLRIFNIADLDVEARKRYVDLPYA